jgi:hypothetical protein
MGTYNAIEFGPTRALLQFSFQKKVQVIPYLCLLFEVAVGLCIGRLLDYNVYRVQYL